MIGLLAGLNTAGNVAGTLLQNRANKKLAEYQYTKDLEMWNKGNEYNSPTAQMTRLKQAGLNPNLVYGNSTVVGNTSGQLPKYQAPRVEAPKDIASNFYGMLSQYENIKQQSAQTDVLKQNLLNAQLQGELYKKQIDKMGAESPYWGWNAQNQSVFQEHKTGNEMIKYLRGAWENSGLTDGQIFGINENGPFSKQYQSTTALRETQNNLQQAELRLVEKGVSKSDAMIWRMLVQSGMMEKAMNWLQKIIK